MGVIILVLLTWAKLTIFLRKCIYGTWVFVNDSYKNFYNTNQYQLKNIIDWLAYIEQL